MERLTPKDLVEVLNMPQYGDTTKFLLYAQRLWELENMIGSGKLLAFPCKPGDTVYGVNEVDDGEEIYYRIDEGVVSCFNIEAECREVLVRYISGLTYWYNFKDFGKSVFIDKKQAAVKLKELQSR